MIGSIRRPLTALAAWLFLLFVALPLTSSPASSTAGSLAPDAAPAAQLDIPAAADATVDSLNPNTTYGTDTRLTTGHNARPPGEQRGLVSFNLGTLPAGAVIDAAQLHLNLAASTGGGSVTLTPYLLTASWSETGVNWNNQPAASTAAPAQNVPGTLGEYAWDVTGLAQTWLAGRNFGLVLKGPEGTGDSYTLAFSSRDSRELAPHLLVTYHVPATSTPTATNTYTPRPPTRSPTPTAGPVDTTPPTNPTAVFGDRPVSVWSNKPAILMSWSGASDGRGSGVHGYSYQWATSPSALPDSTEDTTASSVMTSIPQDGASWYFLVRTKDMAGNWAPTAAGAGPYPLDTVPPGNPVLTTDPAPGAWSNDNSISASWTNATDNPGGSGIAGYSTLFTQYVKETPDEVIDTTWNTDGSGIVQDGEWYFLLRSSDLAGNWTPGKVGLGPIKIDATAPSSHAGKGEHEVVQSSVDHFPVRISGADNLSGIKAIVVQYQDMTVKGPWLQWLANAQPDQQYAFIYSKSGHLYCFRTQAIDNAGNVEKWPPQADSCVAAATADLVAERLTMTQGIQNYDGDAALIAGRRTFARCYVTSGSGDFDGVSARLSVRNNSGTLLGVLMPLNQGGTITVKAAPNRGSFGDSFFFEVPVAWVTTAGALYACNVNLDGKYWEKTLANNTQSLSTNALPSPLPLKLFLVDMPYWQNGTLRKPRWADVWAIESYLKRIFPITQIKLQTGYYYPSYNGLPSKDAALDDLTEVWMENLIWNDGDPSLFWYGMLANDAGNVGGLAWRPGRVGVGSVGPQWRGCSVSDGPWDLDDSCGDHVAAHELGHSFGRKHVACTGAEAKTDANYPYKWGMISTVTAWSDPKTWYGFDAEDDRIMGPTWTDVMGYCQNQWISDYNYFSIYGSLSNTAASTALVAALDQPRSEQLWVSALVTRDGVATLRPFKRIPDGVSIVPGGAGEYTIRLVGPGDAVEAEYPVDVLFEEPDADGVLAATVPWVSSTKEVAIYHGARLLTTRQVSAHPPAVTLLEPNGGERLDGPSVTVRWQGSDPDGDSLSFDIEYSTDGGAHWRLLGGGMTGATTEIALDWLPGSQQARFRITATDGVNTARDASDADFTVPGKAPVAGILSPQSHLAVSYGQLVTFEGSAVDPEDGSIGESALRWSSNVAGTLGTGALLQTSDLITGTHMITLSAMDRQGHAGSATVRVFVGVEPNYLPLIVR